MAGGGSCGKVQAAVGGPQVSDPRNLASASPACWGHSWALPHLCRMAGWTDRWTNKGMKESSRGGRGKETLKQCSRG